MTRPCEICNQPIEEGRAECLPDTRLCVKHARMIDKYGGEFKLTASQNSLGKAGSMKKNYGDVSVETSRNHEAMQKLWKEIYGDS